MQQENNQKQSSISIPVAIIAAGFIIAIAISANNYFKNSDSKNTNTPKAASITEPLKENKDGDVQFNITASDHIRGDINAPITLVEFSDFECPFCERHYPTLNKILSDYKGKVRLVYKHFPLGFHPNAQKAAEASECAGEQDKFWEYHDKLFENQPQGYSLDKFKQWAEDLGLNSGKFNDCLDSGKYAQKVQTDYQEGTQKGVNGTPATFVNGQLLSGALPYWSFKQVIDGLLSQ